MNLFSTTIYSRLIQRSSVKTNSVDLAYTPNHKFFFDIYKPSIKERFRNHKKEYFYNIHGKQPQIQRIDLVTERREHDI